MPKYVQVAAHLTPDELEQQYRKRLIRSNAATLDHLVARLRQACQGGG